MGGTTTVIGRLCEDGFSVVEVLATDPSDSPEALLSAVAAVVRREDPSPAGLGMGIAGLVARDRGVLLSSPNLPEWSDYPLLEELGELFSCPLAVDNDTNTFARAAIERGDVPYAGLWLVLTLGTGIGGTVVLDGNILYGTGFAGEFGHMSVEADGLPCPCGSMGCWERYAASPSVMRYFERAGGNRTAGDTRDVARLAAAGDRPAVRAFSEHGRWLGIGLANLAHCLSPAGMVLGGGLAGAAPLFLGAARREYRMRCPHRWNVSIIAGGSQAGAAGAALLGRDAAG